MKLYDFGMALLIAVLITWAALLEWAPSQRVGAELAHADLELVEALKADA